MEGLPGGHKDEVGGVIFPEDLEALGINSRSEDLFKNKKNKKDTRAKERPPETKII